MVYKLFNKKGLPLNIDSSGSAFQSFDNVSTELFETEKILLFEEAWVLTNPDRGVLPCSLYDGIENLIKLLQYIMSKGIVTLQEINREFFEDESFVNPSHNLEKITTWSSYIDQLEPDFWTNEFRFKISDAGLDFLNEYFLESEYRVMTELGFEKRLIRPRFDFTPEDGENMRLFFRWDINNSNVKKDEIFLYEINSDDINKYFLQNKISDFNYEVLPTLRKWTDDILEPAKGYWEQIADQFTFDAQGDTDVFTDDERFKFYYNPLLNPTRVIYDSNIDTRPFEINVALNSENEDVYNRNLNIFIVRTKYEKETNEYGEVSYIKDTFGNKRVEHVGERIFAVELEGEVIGEDERFLSMLENFGRQIDNEDFYMVRDYDLNDDKLDYIKINEKRKELLLEGNEIYPYMGSYKAFLNGLKWLNYQDIRIREYFYNIQTWKEDEFIEYKGYDFDTNLKTGWKYHEDSFENYTNKIFDDELHKFKIRGSIEKDEKGNYLSKNFDPTWKKTTRMGLTWQYNRFTGELDTTGDPIIENKTDFSPEEVLIKLYGLKKLIYKYFLPHNARIINICLEGIYFVKVRLLEWHETLRIDTVARRTDFDLRVVPKEQKLKNLFDHLKCVWDVNDGVPNQICDIMDHMGINANKKSSQF